MLHDPRLVVLRCCTIAARYKRKIPYLIPLSSSIIILAGRAVVLRPLRRALDYVAKSTPSLIDILTPWTIRQGVIVKLRTAQPFDRTLP